MSLGAAPPEAHHTHRLVQGRKPFASWLALSVLGLVCMLVGLLYLQWRQSEAIEANARLRADSVAALTFQFEREYLRLRHTLDLAVASPATADLDEVSLRHDIFRSRLNLLLDNPSIALLNTRSEYQTILPKLSHLADLGDAVFVQMPTAAELARFQEELSPLGPDVQALSLAANSEMSQLIETKQATIRKQAQTLQFLTLGMVVLLVVVAFLLRKRQQVEARERAALEQLTQELREAQHRAEAANQGKTRFLANMSHELRTPFNGVLGMLTLLESTPLTAEQQDHVVTAKSSAQHLLALLNDILDVSALEAGKLTIHPEAVDLHRLLHEVTTLIRGTAHAKGLAFEVELQPQLPHWVRTDPTRLKQILFNVLGNGVKFTSQGTVGLKVECTGVLEGNASLRFIVSDTGIGMDESALARLFQRFYQVESHAARRFGGSGLGLEISRNLARMMGGDLTVTSTPGKGSVFTLALVLPESEPVGSPDSALPTPSPKPGGLSAPDGAASASDAPKAPAAPAKPASDATSTSCLQGLKVLVAEDHPVNRKLVGALLGRLGCDSRFTENGQEAVDAMNEAPAGHFQLVLMDIHMPVMDGLTATRTIRAMGSGKGDVPIVALTADVMNDAEENALSAGVSAFMTKPIRLPELQATMERLCAVDRHQAVG